MYGFRLQLRQTNSVIRKKNKRYIGTKPKENNEQQSGTEEPRACTAGWRRRIGNRYPGHCRHQDLQDHEVNVNPGSPFRMNKSSNLYTGFEFSLFERML